MLSRARRAFRQTLSALGYARHRPGEGGGEASETPQRVQEDPVAEPHDLAIERAIGQLEALHEGTPDLDVRVAGVRALEQIARASEEHRAGIVAALSAYVCQHARGGRPEDPRRQVLRLRLDV